MLSLYGCSASSVSQVDDSYSGGNDSVSNIEDSGGSVYDYDKGYGYTAPEPGQSFSDYVKEQDPEFYESLFEYSWIVRKGGVLFWVYTMETVEMAEEVCRFLASY